MKTPTGIATSLEFFNEWRREDEFSKTKMPDPYELGRDIDIAVMLLREHAATTAERDQLRAELAAERARLDYVLKNDCPWNDRSEIDQDIKNMSAESKK